MDEPQYWPFYCEENVWHLAAGPHLAGGGAWVVILSNAARSVALWAQRAAARPAEPVFWDYHVLLAIRDASGTQVWDLDSRLGAPVAAGPYLDVTFAGTPWLAAEHAPRFRLLEAGLYRRILATDRRHMRRADGSWIHPPPPWPAIGQGSNLERLIDPADDLAGEVLDLAGFRRWTQGLEEGES